MTTPEVPVTTAAPAASAAPAAPAAPAASVTSSFSIPEEYKDKAYLKGVDSQDKLFKMLDGAETLLGKNRVAVLDDKATDEDRAKFAAAMRPAKAEDYQFENVEGARALEARDPEVVKQVQSIFYEAGLQPWQAKKIQAAYDKMQAEYNKKLDTEFEGLTTQIFGAEKDAKLASARNLLEEFAPPLVKAKVATLPNDQLIILAAALNGIKAKYIKEDGVRSPSGGGGGMNETQIRAETTKLMASEAYRDFQHPEHKITVERVQALYAMIK